MQKTASNNLHPFQIYLEKIGGGRYRPPPWACESGKIGLGIRGLIIGVPRECGSPQGHAAAAPGLMLGDSAHFRNGSPNSSIGRVVCKNRGSEKKVISLLGAI